MWCFQIATSEYSPEKNIDKLKYEYSLPDFWKIKLYVEAMSLKAAANSLDDMDSILESQNKIEKKT